MFPAVKPHGTAMKVNDIHNSARVSIKQHLQRSNHIYSYKPTKMNRNTQESCDMRALIKIQKIFIYQ